jgi:hypothetical protein
MTPSIETPAKLQRQSFRIYAAQHEFASRYIREELHKLQQDYEVWDYPNRWSNRISRLSQYRYGIEHCRQIAREIGGGFGVWPHLIMSIYPNVRKIAYIDIPPMIYVGTQYLRHSFGDIVKDYRETRESGLTKFQNNDSREILCLCPWQIEKLAIETNIFWNASSFSEMTPEIVRNYATHVGRNLSNADSNICLVLNKLRPTANGSTAMPDQIVAGFGNSFEFKEFEVEHSYTHGLKYLKGHKITHEPSIADRPQT